MKNYYSPSKNALYSDSVCGPKEIVIFDPNWVRPVLEDGSLDFNAQAPTILVSNPDCKIPEDSRFITDEQYQELMDGQFSKGLQIVPSETGEPILVNQASETIDKITARIKKERDRRIQTGGYKVGENWFHSDAFSRTQQMNLKALGSDIPPDLLWKTMDGTRVLMTQELATQICSAQVVSDSILFEATEEIICNLKKAEDPTGYFLSVTWPKVYGE